jgi:hypothetical protein
MCGGKDVALPFSEVKATKRDNKVDLGGSLITNLDEPAAIL